MQFNTAFDNPNYDSANPENLWMKRKLFSDNFMSASEIYLFFKMSLERFGDYNAPQQVNEWIKIGN